MDSARWKRIKEIYQEASEREPEERAVFLTVACAGHDDLRREVESLLAQPSADDLLDRPAWESEAGSRNTPSDAALPAIGQRVAHYEIQAKLGEGGMGAVYRAFDTQLHRPVALKVLPPEYASDPEWRSRLLREARAASALNHPNIVGTYEVGSDNGVDFFAMEYVEGKSLTKIIPAGGMGLDETLDYAVQIAGGLAKAHAAGVIHRDLKPGNIMLNTDGLVKLLDFGLARRAELGPGHESTVTMEGRIMGTPAYMSPEQAQGQSVDARSDIFSLGVVLYEMATGTRPFRGDSAMSVISSILKDSPPAPAEVNPAVPRDLDRIVRRCLVKDAARRYQSAVDLHSDLEDLQLRAASGEALEFVRPGTRRRLPKRFVLIVVGVLTVITGYAIFRRAGQTGSPRPALVHAEFSQLTSQPGVEWFPSLSPDGKWLVYAGASARGRQIYLQSVSGQNPFDLSKDPTVDDDQPVFSPDGERIAFRSSREGGGIFVMGRTGEAARRVTHMGFKPSWSPDGTQLAFTTENVELNPQNVDTRSELWVVTVSNGKARRLNEGDAVLASWSPHNHRIAYTHRLGNPAQAELWTISVTGGTPTQVTGDRATNWNPVWSPDGKYLYYASDRGGSTNLWRVPIDETSGKARAEPEPITTPAPYLAHPSLSADGKRIAYTSVLVTANIQQLALDPSGAPKGEPAWATTGSLRWSDPDPSPDGEWVAFYSLVQPGGHLYVTHPDGTAMRQLTSDSATDRMPRWSPDGRWIACFSNRSGHLELWKIRPDGSDLQQLTEGGAGYLAWSPDGSRIATVGAIEAPVVKWRVLVFDPNRPWKQQTPDVLPPLDPPSVHFLVNSWSPDGEHLAGHVDSATQGIVMYSLRSRKYERLTDFGQWPVWLPHSNRVMFVAAGKAFYIVDTQSKQVRKIFSVTRDILGPPQLTRDGKTAYFSRRVTESDIWLLTLK
ncbi:MAG: protein kinase domain-containing protein [Bryobacteraceae bacterium]